MGNARICDRCGTVFSESSIGWQKLSGTKVVWGNTGREGRSTEMDMCVSCVHEAEENFNKKMAPRITKGEEKE